MNCLESHEQLQRILDGLPPGHDLETHLALCKNCREEHALARDMIHGLGQMSQPTPSDGLTDAIMRSVLRDLSRRAARRRLLTAFSAAAASIALFVFLLDRHDEPKSSGPPVPIAQAAPPSLEENVQQAGQALVDLTRRTAFDTLESSRALLPAVELARAGDSQLPMPEMPAQSRQAWSDAVGGLSVGFEPLAASARQAASFFKRETPLLGQEQGPGM